MHKILITLILATVLFCSACAPILVPVPVAKVKAVHPGIHTEIIFPMIPVYLPSVFIHGSWKHGHRHYRHCH